MRTDTYFAKSTDSHSYQSFLNSSDNLALPKHRYVVDESVSVLTADPILRNSTLFPIVIYPDFVALIEKDSAVVNDRMSGFRCGTRTLLIFQNPETGWELHSYK